MLTPIQVGGLKPVLIFVDEVSSLNVFSYQGVPGHPHRVTFGKNKFHLPSGLPLCTVVQVILQDLWILLGILYYYTRHNYITIQDTIISKEAERWPDVFGKIINKNEK